LPKEAYGFRVRVYHLWDTKRKEIASLKVPMPMLAPRRAISSFPQPQ
jgi:hypothetical protein